MEQTAKANPRTHQARSEEARCHLYGHLAEELLAIIQNISDQQWIIERVFPENRTHFLARALDQDPLPSHGLVAM